MYSLTSTILQSTEGNRQELNYRPRLNGKWWIDGEQTAFQTVCSNVVVTSHVWLLKLIKIKFRAEGVELSGRTLMPVVLGSTLQHCQK
jgi:hypothetical protein